jgi:hypothetical protein
MRYSGPQLLSSWLHGASAVGNQAASSLASSAVGAAELTVRRRCPDGSRTTGLARLNEVRLALPSLVRDRGRRQRSKLESGK